LTVQEEYLITNLNGLTPIEIIEVFKSALSNNVDPIATLEYIDGDFHLFWDREETEEEKQNRLIRENKQEELQEKREREVLARLKAKYEATS